MQLLEVSDRKGVRHGFRHYSYRQQYPISRLHLFHCDSHLAGLTVTHNHGRRRFLKAAATRSGDVPLPGRLSQEVVDLHQQYVQICLWGESGIYFYMLHGEEPTSGQSIAHVTVERPPRFWS